MAGAHLKCPPPAGVNPESHALASVNAWLSLFDQRVPPLQEEADKRAARASRFQLEAPLPAAAALDSRGADSELEARARRAARFGMAYQPAEAVLMDMGAWARAVVVVQAWRRGQLSDGKVGR